MKRFRWKVEGRTITAYYVTKSQQWFFGRGCHMKAFSAWGKFNPHILRNPGVVG